MAKLKDYTGQKFRCLECISLSDPPRIKNDTYWKCKCDCGNIIDVKIKSLVDGSKSSCGCLIRLKDYTGKKFGRLECISLSDPPRIKNDTYWKCKCDCGNIIDVRIRTVVNGNKSSCGCLWRETGIINAKKAHASWRSFTKQQADLIRQELQNGKSIAGMARDLQVSENTIRSIKQRKYY